MQTAPDAVWKALGKASYPDHLTEATLDARLATERLTARQAETQPARLIMHIAAQADGDAETQITELLASPAVDAGERDVEDAIAVAAQSYPGAVAAGLVKRVAANLSLPYRAGRYLKDAPLIETGPVAEAALSPATKETRLLAAAAAIGPAIVAGLLEQFIDVDEQQKSGGRYEESLAKAHSRLLDALCATRPAAFFPAFIAKSKTKDPRRIGLLADVLARHGGESGEKPPTVDAIFRDGLRLVVKGWIEALCAVPEPARHAACEVARAAGRLADGALAEPLRALLERDLVDQANARAARLQGRGQGVYDDTICSGIYAGAFSSMHDEAAISVLKSGIGDLRWGTDAAGALYRIWQSDHPSDERRSWGGGPDYSLHLSRRAERAAGHPPTSDIAEAIFAVVSQMGAADRPDDEQRHAIQLAVTALGLPHGAKRLEIDALLSLSQPVAGKRRLLSAAARAGETVPVALVMQGLRELLSASEKEPWRLDEKRGELMDWIELFPFSDDPASALEALKLLPEGSQRPFRLRRLLNVVPKGPPTSAVVILKGLAEANPEFFQEFEWTDAWLEVNTEDGALVLLDYLCRGLLANGHSSRLSDALARWAQTYPAFRKVLVTRYQAVGAGWIRSILEGAMSDIVDEAMFWVLFDGNVGQQNAFQGVARAIEKLAVGRKPAEDWEGAFEEFSLPLTALRARLFGMVEPGDARAELAQQCLVAIDYHRDEHGRVSSEPRHPDISSGRAWPPEAEDRKTVS